MLLATVILSARASTSTADPVKRLIRLQAQLIQELDIVRLKRVLLGVRGGQDPDNLAGVDQGDADKRSERVLKNRQVFLFDNLGNAHVFLAQFPVVEHVR